MHKWKEAALRLGAMGLIYLVVIILAGELEWRRGGGLMFFSVVWAAQCVGEVVRLLYNARNEPASGS